MLFRASAPAPVTSTKEKWPSTVAPVCHKNGPKSCYGTVLNRRQLFNAGNALLVSEVDNQNRVLGHQPHEGDKTYLRENINGAEVEKGNGQRREQRKRD